MGNGLITSCADLVRQTVASAPLLLEWADCQQILLEGMADTPAWILALPVVSCLAVGGSQADGIQVAAGWLALNHALHLLDAVEDGDFVPDKIVDKPEKALNLSTALTFVAYSFFPNLQSSEASIRVVKVCSECGYNATQGQHRGFESAPALLDDAINAYWETTILKSGSLFRMACAGGAAAGTQSSQLIEILADFGTSIGVILQVLDDCRDMFDVQTGRREVTLPILLYSAASGSQKIIFPDSRASLQETSVPGGITASLSAWWQRAHDSLDRLEPSDAIEALKDALQAILGTLPGGDNQ